MSPKGKKSAKKSRSKAAPRKKKSAAKKDSVQKVPGLVSRLMRELWLLICLGVVLFCMVSVSTVFLVQEAGMSLQVKAYVGRFGGVIGTQLVRWFGGSSALFMAMVAGYLFALWNQEQRFSFWKGVREVVRVAGLVVLVAALGWIIAGGAGGGIIGGKVGSPLHRGVGALGALIFSGLLLVILVPTQAVVQFFTRVTQVVSLLFYGGTFAFAAVWSRLRASLSFCTSLAGRGLSEARRVIKEFFARRRETKKAKQAAQQVKPVVTLKKNRKKERPAMEPLVSPEVVLPKAVKRSEHWEDYEARFEDYTPPSSELLSAPEHSEVEVSQEYYDDLSATITQKLADFNVAGRVTRVHPGPVITLFEFEPAPGIKVGKITALVDDLTMSLRALSLRILAPIPGQGTVGIEVPNHKRQVVYMREVLESGSFIKAKSSLTIPLGQDTKGQPVVADISRMPHLLIAGATGTGKSVCINSILMGLLFRASPQELGLILIDPKILELSIYQDIPHLRVPVVTVAKQARAVLQWAVAEMERRYRLMQKLSVRNIDNFNQALAAGKVGTLDLSEEDGEPRPLQKIVIVIDELADLMLQVGRDIEELITRLAQKARAAGIHLIVATQRPSVDVITGLIKANFPARMSFRVSSRIDSRTILDCGGAERLLGRGDMLFLAPGTHTPRRVHGTFVSDEEVAAVVGHIKSLSAPQYDQRILEMCERALEEDDSGTAPGLEVEEYDPIYDKAVQLVVAKGQASTSMVQRAFRIGYNRAARIIDTMEREGVVGPMDGSKPREILVGAIDTAPLEN